MPFGFLSGALVWGSGLIGVPIIIHLLNRRRFRIIDWAAMEWLLVAIKQNKRRITLEQLILLALRCLIIFLIVLAVSRMFFRSGGTAVGALIGTTTDWVVVLDDSYSMGQTAAAGTGTCFDRAREETAALLKKILSAGQKDSFTVVATERRGGKLPATPQVDRGAVKRILRELEHTNPSDLKLSASGLLEHGIEALRGGESANKALVIISDCRRNDWTFSESERAALKKNLDEAEQLGARTYLVDVGPDDPRDFANLAVVELAVVPKTVHAGAAAEVTATVKNFGPDDVTGVPLTFVVSSPVYGDNALPTKTIGQIAAGDTASATLFYNFKTSGAYSVRAEIGSDRLPADNARFLALDVGRGIDALLVDGEPALDRTESETYTLAHALAPRSGFFGVNVKVVDTSALTPSHIDRASVVFLANVFRLSAESLTALREFVGRGGGLVILPGDKVDPVTFNELMFDNGKGIAPCELGRAVGDPEDAARAGGKFVRLSARHLGHTVMADFRNELAVLVTGARFYRRFKLKLPADLEKDGLAVVARYDDADRSPAMVEKRVGEGKVVLGTSSVDSEWNNWPNVRTYAVVMHRLVEYLYTPAGGTRNLAVGAKYVKPVDLTRYDLSVTVEPPKRGAALKRAAQVDPSGAAVVTIKDTRSAGVYALRLKSRSGVTDNGPPQKGADIEYFAANLDVSESDLKTLPRDGRFQKTLEELGITYGTSADDIWKDAPEERVNLWRLILIALGCCLALESFLGWKFGHHAA